MRGIRCAFLLFLVQEDPAGALQKFDGPVLAEWNMNGERAQASILRSAERTDSVKWSEVKQ